MNHRMISTAVAALALGVSVAGLAFTPSTTEVDGRHVPQIEWDTALKKFQFDHDKFLGQRFTAACPPAPKGDTPETVEADTAFDSTYAICRAALQTGAIEASGGIATVQLNPGGPVYGGSAGASARRTMTVVGAAGDATADQVYRDHVQRIDWDAKFTRTGYAYKHLIGQRFTFNCPAAPSNMRPRRVVGTDLYAYDSSICRAAVHAGAVTLDGGLVTVQMNPGNIKLSGSVRNGVETHEGSSGLSALSFVDNPISP